MARWTDIATWVGPTTARSPGAMANPPRGLVLHIASGFYEGTISWQKRTSGSDRTSSHFIVARDGRCAQMVDTADGSWAQRAGNNTWLSIELEGFAPDDALHASHPGWETATAAQLEVCAKLLARAHRDFGVPLQLATSPDGRGLGHHSMGAESGVDWGHSACPGTAIKAQKPAILARAQELVAGTTTSASREEDDMGFEIGLDCTNVAVPGGGAWRDTWLQITNDTGFGNTVAPDYALRIWAKPYGGDWVALVAGGGQVGGVVEAGGLVRLRSGETLSWPLPKDTRVVSIRRMAVGGAGHIVAPRSGDSMAEAYQGPLGGVLERP